MLRTHSRVRALTTADRDQALEVCARDTRTNVFVAARILDGGLATSPGAMLGYAEGSGLDAICWASANLVPVGCDGPALAAFAGKLRRWRHHCSSVFGPADMVLPLWEALRPSWGRPRAVRVRQPVLATAGPLVLGDTKEGTFGIRLRKELSAPNDHMINSNGAHGEPAIWGKPADWVAYSGAIAGKTVGLAVFDAPTSFRHPTTWHARAYGLFSANPFGRRAFTRDKNQDGSWTIPEGESITFRYRVVLYDGELPPARLAEMYREYSQHEGARR